MCYIIYYETKYAKNEEDFLPTSIDESLLEIWETLAALSTFVSVTKYGNKQKADQWSEQGNLRVVCTWKTPGLYPLAFAKRVKR